ncbi:MAG: cobalamin biosynthesis protein CbiX [Verrucomicrobia bacterium]|nr:cobalamin biosynthesis protein CbiX [Verrucomicrobiota bacterium]
MGDAGPCTLLVDNGSHRPESTLSLRRIAGALSGEVGEVVHPVSLLHSTRAKAEDLEGVPAEIFEPFLKKRREEGGDSFLVVPLFFGHSAAIYEYLPQRVVELRQKWPELEVRIAPCLVDITDPGDTGVAEILAGLVRKKIAEEKLSRPAVTLVDHGTPRKFVNDVRNFLGGQLKELLREDAVAVVASSMERRAGEEYAFNEPLLENLLGSAGFEGEVVLSMLFISPGRHAGPGGDIAEICEAAEKRCPGLRTVMGDLFATHPGVVPLLARRFREGVGSAPIVAEVAPPTMAER